MSEKIVQSLNETLKNQTESPIHTELTMNTTDHNSPTPPMDESQIARHVLMAREALDLGAQNLPHEITERLRIARLRALSTPAKQAPVGQDNVFNLGTWFNHLSSWMRGGIAVATLAIVSMFALNTNTTDTQNASQQALSVGNQTLASSVAERTSGQLVAALPKMPSFPNIDSLSSKTNQIAKNTNNTTNAANSGVRVLTASSVPSEVEDDQVDIILREKIPLQAYLNEDFNQFAERQVVSNSEPNK